MRVLGIRYCMVSESAKELSEFFERKIGLEASGQTAGDEFVGATFPVGGNRIEVWPASDEMPAMTMLQIVVDDAEAWAREAKAKGLDIFGPTLAHGERIYGTTAPGGLPISIQSKDEHAPTD